MPGTNQTGGPVPDLPPDVPPEFAEAYRAGFERAYAERAGEPWPEEQLEHPEGDDGDPRGAAGGVGAAVAGFLDDAAHADRNKLVVPAVLVGIAVLLILGAYGVGRLLSDQVSGADVAADEPAEGVVLGTEAGEKSAGGQDKGRSKQAGEKPYRGAVHSVGITGASASCTSESSVDAAGNPVTYEVGNAFDGQAVTAWRCDGNGVGERLTLTLPKKTTIGEVGLIPGYAKTDPVDGSDRYAQNNRITRVRWIFDDGTTVTQRFDGSPDNRSLRTKRIAETTTSKVVIEILGSTPGPRNTVAISEIELGAVE